MNWIYKGIKTAYMGHFFVNGIQRLYALKKVLKGIKNVKYALIYITFFAIIISEIKFNKLSQKKGHSFRQKRKAKWINVRTIQSTIRLAISNLQTYYIIII